MKDSQPWGGGYKKIPQYTEDETNMKFIGIWEYDEITEAIQKKSAEILELRKAS